MEKKATNKDVANMAGVSVATVSYVINGKNLNHVSAETRKKVLHAINVLNYTPNPHAVGLSGSSPSSNIVVRTSIKSQPLQAIEVYNFVSALSSIMSEYDSHYRLLLSPYSAPEQISAAACICVDFDKDEFYNLSTENFIPIIAVDCILNDPVFFQINIDLKKLKAVADQHFNQPYTYVCIQPSSQALKDMIATVFSDVLFVCDFASAALLAPKHKNVLLSQPSLVHIYENFFGCNVLCRDENYTERAKATITCIMNAIDRLPLKDVEHFVEI